METGRCVQSDSGVRRTRAHRHSSKMASQPRLAGRPLPLSVAVLVYIESERELCRSSVPRSSGLPTRKRLNRLQKAPRSHPQPLCILPVEHDRHLRMSHVDPDELDQPSVLIDQLL